MAIVTVTRRKVLWRPSFALARRIRAYSRSQLGVVVLDQSSNSDRPFGQDRLKADIGRPSTNVGTIRKLLRSYYLNKFPIMFGIIGEMVNLTFHSFPRIPGDTG